VGGEEREREREGGGYSGMRGVHIRRKALRTSLTYKISRAQTILHVNACIPIPSTSVVLSPEQRLLHHLATTGPVLMSGKYRWEQTTVESKHEWHNRSDISSL
jgi:hypothetical protein